MGSFSARAIRSSRAAEITVGVSDRHPRAATDLLVVLGVLHDLNHACRYATQLVAMKSGRIVAHSRPDPNDSSDLVHEVSGCAVR